MCGECGCAECECGCAECECGCAECGGGEGDGVSARWCAWTCAWTCECGAMGVSVGMRVGVGAGVGMGAAVRSSTCTVPLDMMYISSPSCPCTQSRRGHWAENSYSYSEVE